MGCSAPLVFGVGLLVRFACPSLLVFSWCSVGVRSLILIVCLPSCSCSWVCVFSLSFNAGKNPDAVCLPIVKPKAKFKFTVPTTELPGPPENSGYRAFRFPSLLGKYVFHVFHLGAEIRRIHSKYMKNTRNTCVFAFMYFIWWPHQIQIHVFARVGARISHLG